LGRGHPWLARDFGRPVPSSAAAPAPRRHGLRPHVAGAKRAGGKHPRSGRVSGPGRPPARSGTGDGATLAALCAGWRGRLGCHGRTLHAMAEVCRAARLKQYDAVWPPPAGCKRCRGPWKSLSSGPVPLRPADRGPLHGGKPGPRQTASRMQGGIATALPQCQTLMELGQVNEVEHLAQESLENGGRAARDPAAVGAGQCSQRSPAGCGGVPELPVGRSLAQGAWRRSGWPGWTPTPVDGRSRLGSHQVPDAHHGSPP